MVKEASKPRHLLALEGLSRDEILDYLLRAEALLPVVRGDEPMEPRLTGRVVANVFLEDSTRTRCSFTVAAHRLGATCVDLAGPGSSRSKGESLIDTSRNIEAMGVDAIVIRCDASGGPALVASSVACPVVNAGDGRHEHPTQGLLDLLALRRRLGELRGRTVAIVGDIGASRVARSALHGLTTLGANVILVGPPGLVPPGLAIAPRGPGRARIEYHLDPLLPKIDAIMMLRVQFERGSAISRDYRTNYGLTTARAERLRPGVPVLHPGPINRGLELDGQVADDPHRSAILDQVTGGVAVRMAVLEAVIGPMPNCEPRLGRGLLASR